MSSSNAQKEETAQIQKQKVTSAEHQFKEVTLGVDPQKLTNLLRSQTQPKNYPREATQNSLDAKATKILHTFSYENGILKYSVSDNGKGMSVEAIREHFLTLMNSDKSAENGDRGTFGIGRLAILGFKPDQIVLETSDGTSGHRAIFNQNLEMELYEAPELPRGTTLTFTKKTDSAEAKKIERQLKAGLIESCKYAETPIYFNGHKINKKLDILNGYFKEKISYPGCKGITALNDAHNQKILIGGILVEEGKPFPTFPAVIMNVDPSFGLTYSLARNSVDRDEKFEELKKIMEESEHKTIKNAASYVNKVKHFTFTKPSLRYRMAARDSYNKLASKMGEVWGEHTSDMRNVVGLAYHLGLGGWWTYLAVGSFLAGNVPVGVFELGVAAYFAYPAPLHSAIKYVAEEFSFIKNHAPRLPGGHKARVAREYLFSVLDEALTGREALEYLDKELLDAKLFFSLDCRKRYSVNDLLQQAEKNKVIYVADKKSEATDHFHDSGAVIINTEKRQDIVSVIARISPIINLSQTLPTRREENPTEKEKRILDKMQSLYEDGVIPVKAQLGYIEGDVGNKISAQMDPMSNSIMLNKRSPHIMKIIGFYDIQQDKAIYSLASLIMDIRDPVDSDKPVFNMAVKMVRR